MIRKCSHRGDTYKTCFWKMSKGEKSICLKSRLIPFLPLNTVLWHFLHTTITLSQAKTVAFELWIFCAHPKDPFHVVYIVPLVEIGPICIFSFTFWENCMLRFEFLSDSVLYCMCDVFNISDIFHIKHISDEIVLYLAAKSTCN